MFLVDNVQLVLYAMAEYTHTYIHICAPLHVFFHETHSLLERIEDAHQGHGEVRHEQRRVPDETFAFPCKLPVLET